MRNLFGFILLLIVFINIPKTSFAISPDLPEGLSFSTSTGSITGTALYNSSSANYTIWANDTKLGNIFFNISFGIGNGKPTVTYNETEFIFERGSPISPIVPSEINGSIISWQIVPELPDGLEINNSTGIISGVEFTRHSVSVDRNWISNEPRGGEKVKFTQLSKEYGSGYCSGGNELFL